MKVRFRVYDKETGLVVTNPGQLIDEIVLNEMGDNVQFAIMEDGGLILTDEYNNWVYVDEDRFCVKSIEIVGGE